MDAAVAEEAHQVEPGRSAASLACALLDVLDGADQGRILEKLAALDLVVDPGQVLEHGVAGPDVQVADLGVADLPLRQPDVDAGRLDGGVRRRLPEAGPSPGSSPR